MTSFHEEPEYEMATAMTAAAATATATTIAAATVTRTALAFIVAVAVVIFVAGDSFSITYHQLEWVREHSELLHSVNCACRQLVVLIELVQVHYYFTVVHCVLCGVVLNDGLDI